jgi:hypothetical protein
MALFQKNPSYHAAGNGSDWAINDSTVDDLQKWASDPNCIEKDKCAAALTQKIAKHQALRLEQEERNAAKRAQLQENPFDPRTEVSADARHVARQIVKNLWIIFVVLPFVLGLLYEILK